MISINWSSNEVVELSRAMNKIEDISQVLTNRQCVSGYVLTIRQGRQGSG